MLKLGSPAFVGYLFFLCAVTLVDTLGYSVVYVLAHDVVLLSRLSQKIHTNRIKDDCRSGGP